MTFEQSSDHHPVKVLPSAKLSPDDVWAEPTSWQSYDLLIVWGARALQIIIILSKLGDFFTNKKIFSRN
jgi:hypothetical protein